MGCLCNQLLITFAQFVVIEMTYLMYERACKLYLFRTSYFMSLVSDVPHVSIQHIYDSSLKSSRHLCKTNSSVVCSYA